LSSKGGFMPNIIVTNSCNLKCPYCFADDMIQHSSDNNRFIDADTFNKILDFCSRGEQEPIGIIGGEPTLHPYFIDIIMTLQKYCSMYNCEGLIFTNGIKLKPWLSYLGPNIGVLVNCNAPKYQSTKNYEATLDSLKQAYKLGYIKTDKVRVGCNIYLGLDDYSYFWKDIVEPFQVKYIRCSVASPGGCYMEEWRHQDKKEQYYLALKPAFIDFIREAKKHDCILEFDCNQIPPCYFTDEERQEIMEVAAFPPKTFCIPPIDITTDLKAFSCFGTCDFQKEVKIEDFSDLQELRRYLIFTKNLPKVQQNTGGKCAECLAHEKYQCQGGCLSFVELKGE